MGRSEATMIFPARSENAKSGSGQNIRAPNDIAAEANAAHAQSTVRLIILDIDASTALRRRRGSGFLERRVDGGLGTFFAVGAGHAHRADHLAVDYDRQSSRLRKVVHESRRQILAGA